jgi:2-methylcitrate dehydratase
MVTKLALDVNSPKSATILGTRHRSTLEMATFVNVVMARYLDYNDSYHGKKGVTHCSDCILPCLSLSEFKHGSGKEFLLSIVLSYELQARFCDVAPLLPRGWDSAVVALLSTALTTSKLLGLSREATKQSLNIALNSHIAMRQGLAGKLSMWKGCRSAEAIRCAIFSTMLAAEGMTGPSPIFEGEFGIFKQVTGQFDLELPVLGPYDEYKITQADLKLFPSAGHTQGPIWAAIQARKKINDTNEISRIEIIADKIATESGGSPEKWNPENRETADHSLPYTVAIALTDGSLSDSSYEPGRLTDAGIANLMKKITVNEDPAFTDSMHQNKRSSILRVHLASGDRITERVDYPRGSAKNPVSDQELEDKFRHNVKDYFTERQAERIIHMIWKLDEVKNVTELVEACAVKSL